MKPTQNSDEARLYRTYWKLCLEDILFHLSNQEGINFPPNSANKELLHDFHKSIFGYDTISDQSYEVLSKFIQEVCMFWASERGIFVRTSGKQPLGIEMLDLFDIIEHEGKKYRIWDLL